jgi:hypothetical protein
LADQHVFIMEGLGAAEVARWSQKTVVFPGFLRYTEPLP